MTQEIAQLMINGREVGRVTRKGGSDGWAYGDFEPSPEFTDYALLFGSWSLLMHEDEDQALLSEAMIDELRQAEQAIDALRAELRWMKDQSITPVVQLNIDGPLIEWRH
jgi:hypothetical protein